MDDDRGILVIENIFAYFAVVATASLIAWFGSKWPPALCVACVAGAIAFAAFIVLVLYIMAH